MSSGGAISQSDRTPHMSGARKGGSRVLTNTRWLQDHTPPRSLLQATEWAADLRELSSGPPRLLHPASVSASAVVLVRMAECAAPGGAAPVWAVVRCVELRRGWRRSVVLS